MSWPCKRRVRRRRLIPINSWDEVPDFANEDEEHEFWPTHSLGRPILDQMGPLEDGILPPPRPRSRLVMIRFEDNVFQRLRALASLKGKDYQTVLKELVIERLYEEGKRAGLVD